MQYCDNCEKSVAAYICSACGRKLCPFCATITSRQNKQHFLCPACGEATPIGTALLFRPRCSVCGRAVHINSLVIHPFGCDSLRKFCSTCQEEKEKEECGKRCIIEAVCKRCLKKLGCAVIGRSPTTGRKRILRYLCPRCGGTLSSF